MAELGLRFDFRLPELQISLRNSDGGGDRGNHTKLFDHPILLTYDKHFMRGCVGSLMEKDSQPAEELWILEQVALTRPTPQRSNRL